MIAAARQEPLVNSIAWSLSKDRANAGVDASAVVRSAEGSILDVVDTVEVTHDELIIDAHAAAHVVGVVELDAVLVDSLVRAGVNHVIEVSVVADARASTAATEGTAGRGEHPERSEARNELEERVEAGLVDETKRLVGVGPGGTIPVVTTLE